MTKKIMKYLIAATFIGSLGVPAAYSQDSDKILISSVFDVSGEQNIPGRSMLDAINLAVKELNDKGGLLGKKVEFTFYDSENSQVKYMQYANRIALNDKPAVTISGINSASREAIRPIFGRNNILYFYPELYEGGVCDRNMISTNSVPSQTLAALVPWLVNKHGSKRIYIVGADYNFGRISAAWGRKYAEDAGAEVVGEQFVPLGSSNFKSIIDDIQEKKADAVLSFTVGTTQVAFYRDFAAAGLSKNVPIASTVFGLSDEHKILSPNESEGIAVAYNYMESDDTPENDEFLKKWNEAGGRSITSTGVGSWYSVMLWAKAVEKAGSTDREKVLEAFEQGDISVDGPAGVVTIDAATHHAIGDIVVGVVTNDGKFEVVSKEKAVKPAYEIEVCNLLENPDTNKQFTPE